MQSVLISPEVLARRGSEIAASPDLTGLKARLSAELDEFVARPLYIPDGKALLSRWGSACRDDGAELAFDPWTPHAQRCTRCGRVWATEQSHRWWVYWYQLWLAERCWQSALLGLLDGDARFEARAHEVLAGLAERYLAYPNADNVLGKLAVPGAKKTVHFNAHYDVVPVAGQESSWAVPPFEGRIVDGQAVVAA